MPEPLSHEEIARVRWIQRSLRAAKTCGSCGRRKLVAEFAQYGSPMCAACQDADREARRAGVVDVARVGVGA